MHSFYTFDSHNDYVRSMSLSYGSNRLFSISDDGTLAINDIIQGKIVQEYLSNSTKYPVLQSSKYIPVYSVDNSQL